MKQFEYRLNDGTTITCNDVKFYTKNNDIPGEFTIYPTPVEAKNITVFDDTYEYELNHVNEEIQSKRDEIKRLEMDIHELSNEIYELQDKRDDLMDKIEKREMGEDGNSTKNN
jgi:predicted transcriptional regulator